MEEGGCWMVTDRAPEYDDESWEEKAFAKDAAGMLGGCVWPPRSYSCSFCRREFRSAQALGGHMNVHRRDRARLKHQSSSSKSLDQKGDDPHRWRRSSSNHNHPDNNCDLSLVSKTTAFTEQPQETINTTPESDDRVSSFLFRYKNNLSFFCLEHDEENILDSPLINNKKQEKSAHFLFYPNCNERSKDLPTKISKTTHEKASSFIGLPNNSAKVEDNNESNRSKKRKLDTLSSPVKTKLFKKKDDVFEDQAPKVYAPKFEYLDLELRLGDRPK